MPTFAVYATLTNPPEPDSLSYQYHSFLIQHGGIGDTHGKQSRNMLRLMGDCVKSAAGGTSAKFIAPPLDLGIPLRFEENIATGMPIEQMMEFKEYMVQRPHEHIMCSV
jgi:hypothetical protein